jgi:hypothetical protein
MKREDCYEQIYFKVLSQLSAANQNSVVQGIRLHVRDSNPYHPEYKSRPLAMC